MISPATYFPLIAEAKQGVFLSFSFSSALRKENLTLIKKKPVCSVNKI